MSNLPNIDSGPNIPSGNVPPTGGGGSGPGSNPTIDLSNVTSTGGLDGSVGAVVVFGKSLFAQQPIGWQFDSEDFNCEEDCEYHFRVEELEVYRQPTVTKVILRYRDLGRVEVNCFFVGNVLQDNVASKIVTVIFGGKADKKIYTTTFDLTCTFEAPQLIVERLALKGPLSITKVLVEIEHGDAKPV